MAPVSDQPPPYPYMQVELEEVDTVDTKEYDTLLSQESVQSKQGVQEAIGEDSHTSTFCQRRRERRRERRVARRNRRCRCRGSEEEQHVDDHEYCRQRPTRAQRRRALLFAFLATLAMALLVFIIILLFTSWGARMCASMSDRMGYSSLASGLDTESTGSIAMKMLDMWKRQSSNDGDTFTNNKLYLIVIFVGLLLCAIFGILLTFWCCRGSFENPLCCPCYLCACCGGIACLECISCGLCAAGFEQVAFDN